MIPKEIEAIVHESGNTFHCKVANYLKEKEWEILVSPYYMDNATNNPREIDLITEKQWVHDRGSESLLPAIKTTLRQKAIALEMPVVVCNSFADFYGVDKTDTSSRWKIDENFQLEVNCAYLDVNGKR